MEPLYIHFDISGEAHRAHVANTGLARQAKGPWKNGHYSLYLQRHPERHVFFVPPEFRDSTPLLNAAEYLTDGSATVICDAAGRPLRAHWIARPGNQTEIQGWASTPGVIITVTRTRHNGHPLSVTEWSMRHEPQQDKIFLDRKPLYHGTRNGIPYNLHRYSDAVNAVFKKSAANDPTNACYFSNLEARF